MVTFDSYALKSFSNFLQLSMCFFNKVFSKTSCIQKFNVAGIWGVNKEKTEER